MVLSCCCAGMSEARSECRHVVSTQAKWRETRIVWNVSTKDGLAATYGEYSPMMIFLITAPWLPAWKGSLPCPQKKIEQE
jgi:hypothetical protein